MWDENPARISRSAALLFAFGVIVYGVAHWRYFSYIEYNTSRIVVSLANMRLRGVGELHALAYRHPLTGATSDPINVPYLSFIQGQLIPPAILSRFIDTYVAVHIVNLAGLMAAAVVIMWACLSRAGHSTAGRTAPVLAACAALAFLYSPHVFDEFFVYGDHPVAVLPWFVAAVAIEGVQAYKRLPILLPLSYAAIGLMNHSFLLLSVPAAFFEAWDSRKGAIGFLKGLGARLWLAGVVEGAYWGWLAMVSPEYPHMLFARTFTMVGLEGAGRTLRSGLRYVMDATASPELERGLLAITLGKTYVRLMGVQTIAAVALWILLARRRSPRSIAERAFLITLAFYALLTLVFHEAVLEHPYLYTPYLVIALTVASFGMGPSLRDARHAFVRWLATGMLWTGCALLAITLVHGPWRFFDHLRLLDTTYPDRAPVERLADYFSQRWRGQDAVVVIDSDDKETFLAEHVLLNAAALAFHRDADVRVKMVTTQWLREHPGARGTRVPAYFLSMRGSDIFLTTRRGPLNLGFVPWSF